LDFLKLEKKFASFVRTDGCVSVNTGTAALHVALEALQLPAGSKVIVPDFTMYASALAVYYARLTPVFVDCDENLLINLDKVEEVIDKDTKVLMVTHVYGRLVNMERVMSIAKRYNLRVIEDACEAHGAFQSNKMAGSYDIGCFSFYKNKIICAEEGGAVTSNDKNFLNIVRDMKSMSFGVTHDYYHKIIGFNYRMTNSQAREISCSLSKVEENIKKREVMKNYYNSCFGSQNKMPNNRVVVWVYDMKHHNANLVTKELKRRGINARHSFKPMTMQPLFKENVCNVGTNSLYYSKNVFYIHLDVLDTEKELDRKQQIIKKVIKSCD
jgi:dTDP-4-amino-4,6-dideoxygalactose transaminase